MFRFRSMADAHAADLPPPLRAFVERHFRAMLDEYEKLGAEYDPDAEGEFVLLEQGEEVREIEDPRCPALREMVLEVVEYDEESQCFLAVYIPSDSWALSVFVPDAPWLDADVRSFLAAQVEGGSLPAPQAAPT